MFMVGVAMPFSYAEPTCPGRDLAAVVRPRRAPLDRPDRAGGLPRVERQPLHPLTRSSTCSGKSAWDTRSFSCCSAGAPAVQLAAAVAILVADWLLFALYPLPGPDFPCGQYGASEPQIMMTGFFAHWNKNANVAAAFDRWFLNLFPHPPDRPFLFNEGGYATLNFIPSIATMIFGVLAGELLRSSRGRVAKLRILLRGRRGRLVAGPGPRRLRLPDRQADLDSVVGRLLHGLDLLDAGGVLRRDRRRRLPAMVVSPGRRRHELDRHLPHGPAHEAVRRVASLRTHFGPDVFAGPYGPLIRAASILLVFWLICLWLYRQKIFIKI